ncbi:MAG: hypothetical protein ACKOU6_13905, partial [Planctomycetota bacterium]
MSTTNGRFRPSIQERLRRRQQRRLFSETLEARTMMAADANPWHNPSFPGDVDLDQSLTPLDALVVINELNSVGPRLLASGQTASGTGSGLVAGGEA